VFLAAAEMDDRDEVRELVVESYRIIAGEATVQRKPAVARKKTPTKRAKKRK